MENSWLSVYLLAPLLAWLVAQALKAGLDMGNKQAPKATLFRTGGMPSTHSAGMMALLVVIGVRQGFDSALFAVVFVCAAIIMYDAVNVRRSVGEQGEALRKVAKDSKFFVAHGHSGKEVMVGATLGLLVGLGLLQIL